MALYDISAQTDILTRIHTVLLGEEIFCIYKTITVLIIGRNSLGEAWFFYTIYCIRIRYYHEFK